MRPEWQLLRTIDPPDTPDDDWAGDGTPPPSNICAEFSSGPGNGLPGYTGIDVRVIGYAAGAQAARGSNTCTLDCVDVESIGDDRYVGDLDETDTTDVPLGERVYFQLNGSSSFTIRVTANDAVAGVDELRVIWRPVSR